MTKSYAGMDGVLVLDKPAGPSSHACVVAARRRRLAKKIGHAGTLDPFATGVLPLLLGSATRLSRFFTGAQKLYDAVVRFGAATTTCDLEGEVTAEGEVPDRDTILVALENFKGRISQVPPAFSAKSVDGVRSYKRARKGDLTAPPPVQVEIHEVALQCWDPPDAAITVECSAGTYIRSLARDLGEACGSAAHCRALRRTRSGAFSMEQAIALPAFESMELEELHSRVVPMRALLPEFPAVVLSERAVAALRHGKLLLARECEIPAGALESEWVRLLDESGELMALGSNAARFNRPEDFHASVVLAR